MFHREGQKIILTTFFSVGIAIVLAHFYIVEPWLQNIVQILALIILILILQFFRNPKRVINKNFNDILAPVDGKVVVIEEVEENEYFKDKRIQVSIFMSPTNVHITRYPSSGVIKYSKYHPGKYLVAWHPKSSEENERTTVVIKTPKFGEILYRQIAGALARRIVNYAEKKEKKLNELSIEELKTIEPKLTADVLKVFDLKNSVNSKKSYGGTSFDNIKKMIMKYKKL